MRLLAAVVLLLLIPLAGLAQGPTGGVQAFPPDPDQFGSNLLLNSTFDSGLGSWLVFKPSCTTFDSTVDHTGNGGGSVKLSSCGTATGTIAQRPVIGKVESETIRFWAKCDASSTAGSLAVSVSDITHGGGSIGIIGRTDATNISGVPGWVIVPSSGWEQHVLELDFNSFVHGGDTINVGFGVIGQTVGTCWLDDVQFQDSWFPVRTFLVYPNYRGYLWTDKTPPIPTMPPGSTWTFGATVQGQIIGVGELQAQSGSTLASDTLTVTMSTVAGCGSGVLSTKTFPAPLAKQFWTFTPTDYGALTVGTKYFLCSKLTVTSGGALVDSYSDIVVVSENAAFRNGLGNWFDTDNAVVHRGTRSFWLNGTDRWTATFTYNNGTFTCSTGPCGNPSQASAKLFYELDLQGPGPNTIAPLAPNTRTTFTGGPTRAASQAALGYTNVNSANNVFSSANMTPALDQWSPYVDAWADLGMTSNVFTSLYFGKVVTETMNAAVPTFAPTVTTGIGSISANFLFLELAVEAAPLPNTQTGVSPMEGIPTLPSSPVTVNLSTAGCAGVNCSAQFSTPSCPLPTSRYLGYLLYTAVGSTSTPPPNSSFQFQPTSAGQIAQTYPLPCGTTVTLSSLITTGISPVSVDSTDNGRPTWVGAGNSDQSGWTTIASTMSNASHPGNAMMQVGDEALIASKRTVFRQQQTMWPNANGIPNTLFVVSSSDEYRQWRDLLDMPGTDPITGYGTGPTSDDVAVTPPGTNTCPDYGSTNSAQTILAKCIQQHVDVFTDSLGRATYGARPLSIAVGDYIFGAFVGQNYAELRRQELKALIGCQNWGSLGCTIGRWVYANGGLESSWWCPVTTNLSLCNTNQFTDEQTWHTQLNSYGPVLLTAIQDSAQRGTGGIISSVSHSATTSADCGSASIYTNTTNFPFGPSRFVTHTDASGNQWLFWNHLCYGTNTVTVTLASVPTGATQVEVHDNANTTSFIPLTGGKFSYTMLPQDTLVFVVRSLGPSAPNPPTALKVTGLTNTTISLGWTAPSGSFTGYNVYRSTTHGGPYTLVTSGLTTASFTDTGLAAGTYFYVVTAFAGGSVVNVVGNASTATVTCATACSFPSGTSANIQGNSLSAFNGTFTSTGQPSSTTFTFASTTSGTGTGGGTWQPGAESATTNEVSAMVPPVTTVSLVPASLTFGSFTVGATSPSQSTVLTNTSTASASVIISSITITGTNSGDFAQSNNCPSTLAQGASCTITVTFAPLAPGARLASVSVTDTASGSPQTVALSGTGVAQAPAVVLVPSSLVFGPQALSTTSAQQTIVLQNTGSGTLVITSISLTGANAGDFGSSTTCGGTLGAGLTCSINVTFTPTATGTRIASVSIVDSAAGSPHTAALTGTGTTTKCALVGVFTLSGVTITCGP